MKIFGKSIFQAKTFKLKVAKRNFSQNSLVNTIYESQYEDKDIVLEQKPIEILSFDQFYDKNFEKLSNALESTSFGSKQKNMAIESLQNFYLLCKQFDIDKSYKLLQMLKNPKLHELQYNFDEFLIKSLRTFQQDYSFNLNEFAVSIKFLLESIQIPSLLFSPKAYMNRIFENFVGPSLKIDESQIQAVLQHMRKQKPEELLLCHFLLLQVVKGFAKARLIREIMEKDMEILNQIDLQTTSIQIAFIKLNTCDYNEQDYLIVQQRLTQLTQTKKMYMFCFWIRSFEQYFQQGYDELNKCLYQQIDQVIYQKALYFSKILDNVSFQCKKQLTFQEINDLRIFVQLLHIWLPKIHEMSTSNIIIKKILIKIQKLPSLKDLTLQNEKQISKFYLKYYDIYDNQNDKQSMKNKVLDLEQQQQLSKELVDYEIEKLKVKRQFHYQHIVHQTFLKEQNFKKKLYYISRLTNFNNLDKKILQDIDQYFKHVRIESLNYNYLIDIYRKAQPNNFSLESLNIIYSKVKKFQPSFQYLHEIKLKQYEQHIQQAQKELKESEIQFNIYKNIII